MTPKENFLHYVRHEPYEYTPEMTYLPLVLDEGVPPVPYTAGGLPADMVQEVAIPACERPMVGSGYDVFGVHWTAAQPVSHCTPHQKPIYDDIEDWRAQVRIPNVEKLDWETFQQDVEKLDTENKIIMMTALCGLLERGTMLTSMEECMMDIITDPENYYDMMGAIADYKIALINKICQYVHPDIIVYHDDWGTNHGTFISPALWRQVIRPHTQRIYDAMKARNIIICQHTCGDVSTLMDDMVEMGLDMVDLQKKCSNLGACSAKYSGRMMITANDIVNNLVKPAEDGEAPGDRYPAYENVPEFLYS